MSEALYSHGGLRFWHEHEIELRDYAITALSNSVRRALGRNWSMARVEGPILHPRSEISAAYDDNDIFVTNHKDFCLRAETTPSSYAYARWLQKRGEKLPLCIWQAGISNRRETNDGASARKLRFNSFWQLEFQCILDATANRTDGKTRRMLIDTVAPVIERLTGVKTRLIDKDRLPSYSESTIDIECEYLDGWKEVASCSIRTDYSPDTRVAEIAIGLDRLVSIGIKADW